MTINNLHNLMIYFIYIYHDNNAYTTVFTFNFLRWVYFYPTPTKMIGFPVAEVNDNAAPTNHEINERPFSSTVSNLDMMIASISLMVSLGELSIKALLKVTS